MTLRARRKSETARQFAGSFKPYIALSSAIGPRIWVNSPDVGEGFPTLSPHPSNPWLTLAASLVLVDLDETIARIQAEVDRADGPS